MVQFIFHICCLGLGRDVRLKGLTRTVLDAGDTWKGRVVHALLLSIVNPSISFSMHGRQAYKGDCVSFSFSAQVLQVLSRFSSR